MKPAPFTYHRPETVEQALELLAVHEEAKVIAGGQSLMPMLNMRLAHVLHLVDIGRTPGLSGLHLDSSRRVLRIGATTTQRAVERHESTRSTFPILPEALAHVGHFQTRNRGTVGGSLAHADATAELACVARAADAKFQVASVRGMRTISADAFARSHFTTSLEEDELLVAIDFPAWSDKHGFAFEEFARRHGDFAIVCVAALIELGANDRVARAAVAIGGLGATPVRATLVEQSLVGQAMDENQLVHAAEAAAALPSVDDPTYPTAYRKQLARTLTHQALVRAADRVDRANIREPQ